MAVIVGMIRKNLCPYTNDVLCFKDECYPECPMRPENVEIVEGMQDVWKSQ